MGLQYDCVVDAVAATASQDIFEVAAPSDATVLIHSLVIEQSSDTDSEQVNIKWSRTTGSPTSGSGGSSLTPRPRCPGASAAGSTVERNNTTPISGGTSVVLGSAGFNVINGFERYFDPPLEIAPGTYFTVNLVSTPADSITLTCNLHIEEVGG